MDPSELHDQCQQGNWQHAAPQEVPRHQETEKLPGNWGSCCIKMKPKGPHQLPLPRPPIPRQSWRPKPILEWLSWRPRQPDAMFNSNSWGGLFQSHQWCWGSEDLPGHVMFQEEHSKYLQILEEQTYKKESRSHHEVLSSCQDVLYHSLQLLRRGTGCLISPAIRASASIPYPHSASKGTLHAEEQPSTAVPPMPTPKQSPRPKRWLPLPELMGNMSHGQSHPGGSIRGTSQPPRSERTLPGSSHCKPSHVLRLSSGILT